MESSLTSLFSSDALVKFARVSKLNEFSSKQTSSTPKTEEPSPTKKRKERKRKVDVPTTSDNTAIESNIEPTLLSPESEFEPQEEKLDYTIFIGNISLKETAKSIKAFVKQFGEIETIRLRSVPIAGVAVDDAGNQDLVRRVCSNSKKFGDQKGSFNAYVVFKSKDSVALALKANNQVLSGRHIRVDTGRPSVFDNKLTVFLGNLPHYADEEELREHFAKVSLIIIIYKNILPILLAYSFWFNFNQYRIIFPKNL